MVLFFSSLIKKLEKRGTRDWIGIEVLGQNDGSGPSP